MIIMASTTLGASREPLAEECVLVRLCLGCESSAAEEAALLALPIFLYCYLNARFHRYIFVQFELIFIIEMF